MGGWWVLCFTVDTVGVIANEVAEFEFDDSATHVVDGAGVVGGHDDGGAGAVDLVEEDHDAVSGFGVEVAGGFVGEQHEGSVNEGAGDGNTLLFAAGKFVGVAVFFAGKVDEFEGVGDDAGDFVFSGSYDFQGEGYVIVDGFLLEESEVLENVADFLPQFVDLAAFEFIDMEVIDVDVAVGDVGFADHEFEEGGFAGARGADEEDKIAFVDGERNFVECWAG